MASHDIDYKIHGDALQYVEVELDPDETVIAEAGAMLYMDEGIDFETRMGDGSSSGVMGTLFGAAKRMLTSESLFLTHFTNEGRGKQRVAFAAPYPGHIVAIDLSTVGGEIICQKDAFLCAAKGTSLSVAFSKRIGAGFFGGEGFVLQKLKGDGMVFLHAGGSVVQRDLNGEKLRLDTGCLVGFQSGVDYDISMSGGLKSMLFGGEGLFLATLEGHGKVLLQTMPLSRLADRILEHAPKAGGNNKGEG